ncbi:alpha/beta fold hydrolase [Lysobacter antibioticus]|uniref:alpha/beta fold hydrolase n=1 Tax=Lysobacter antibioticus TaxID=84531 RepID=UPI0003499C2E|nr:alpha/beta hydrolase [Lysobacter antibioticus]
MKPSLLAVLLMSSFVCTPMAAAEPAAAEPVPIPAHYAEPGDPIDVPGGRRLNLRCAGEGPQRVVLEAGSNADSTVWYRVVPLLQDAARVCAYDRAGFGFSDAGPSPRDLAADVADLDRVVRAAAGSAPVVLVGHSLGSNIVRRYAQTHPQRVAGLVLLDPPEQGAAQAMPAQWKAQDAAMVERRDALLTACERAAEAGRLQTPEPATQSCLRPPPPWMGEAVAGSIRANKLKPGYWRSLRSELESNRAVFAAPVPAKESYGAIPLRMLVADAAYQGVPEEVRIAMERARAQTHRRILAASAASRRIDLPGSSHDVQLDRPQAVADAVRDLMRAADAPAPAGQAR